MKKTLSQWTCLSSSEGFSTKTGLHVIDLLAKVVPLVSQNNLTDYADCSLLSTS